MSSSVIIENLIEMRSTIENQKNFFIDYLENDVESRFQQIIDSLAEILNRIDIILKADCRHEYEEDWIDIDPEQSQKITYCKICNCTF